MKKANYNSIENFIKQNKAKRNNAALIKEIEDQRQKLEAAEEKKKNLIESGTKEEYLIASRQAAEEAAALEYLEGRTATVKALNRVTPEDLQSYKKELRNKQAAYIAAELKPLLDDVKNLLQAEKAIREEQERGDQLYSEMFKMWEEEASKEEKRQISLNGYLTNPNYFSTGLNRLHQLEMYLENALEVINQAREGK